MIGRIHKIAANDYIVRTPEGDLHCKFRGKAKRERKLTLKLAAVGDEVEVTDVGSGEGTIEKVLPRRSKISRRDSFKPMREQVIVANVDVLVIVQAAKDPDFNDLIVDTCTVMASANKLPCVIVVNKSDLGSPDLGFYRDAGYTCYLVSAKTGEGVDQISEFMKDRTSVFLGPSGVGKSSLLNALSPDLDLKVGDVSRTGEGRHTTSWVELREVGGGLCADTPGLEFFTLWGVTAENLKNHFLDFVDLAGGCRFRNCSHLKEKECGVRDAVAPSRFKNYQVLRDRLRRNEGLWTN